MEMNFSVRSCQSKAKAWFMANQEVSKYSCDRMPSLSVCQSTVSVNQVLRQSSETKSLAVFEGGLLLLLTNLCQLPSVS